MQVYINLDSTIDPRPRTCEGPKTRSSPRFNVDLDMDVVTVIRHVYPATFPLKFIHDKLTLELLDLYLDLDLNLDLDLDLDSIRLDGKVDFHCPPESD